MRKIQWALKFFFFSFFFATAALTMELEKFKPDRFEILVSDSSTQAFESLFGHASLLVIPDGKTWKEGYVFSFMALTSQSSNIGYYTKGVTGGFPFTVEALPAIAFFNNKLVYEKRDIQRTVIPLTKLQKEKLWEQLIDYRQHPEKLGAYYFHIKNCASMIYFLLKKSGIQVNYKQLVDRSLTSGVIPKHLISYSKTVLLAPFPTVSVPATATLIEQLEKKYQVSIGSSFDEKKKIFKTFSTDEIAKISQMSTEELVIVSQAFSVLDQPRTRIMQELIKNKRERVRVSFIRFKEYPQSFYTICEEEDTACFDSLIEDVTAFYTKNEIKNFIFSNYVEQQRAAQLLQPEFNFNTSEQSLHWQKLTKALRAFLKASHD